MLQEPSGHELWVLLNGNFAETIEEVRGWLHHWIAPERVRVWRGPRRTSAASPMNAPRRAVAEVLRDTIIDDIRPEALFVASMFEGLSDDAITGIGLGEAEALRSAILYDLIPLANAAEYLRNVDTAHWYFRQLQGLKRADLLYAISEHSRQEAIGRLALPPDRIVNISGAADEAFQPKPASPEDIRRLGRRYGITRPFVMYTGGFDRRKNIDGLARAYAQLHASLRSGLQLAVICDIKENERRQMDGLVRRLGLRDDEVVFCGYVPQTDLAALYNACELFVFPSLQEGFGLPVLEAMACGAPTIAADNSSIPEIVGAADALFDASRPQAIAEKMTQALTDEGFRQHLRHHALEQARKFSWKRSAKRALGALEHAATRHRRPHVFQPRRPAITPLRLAFVSPLPPLETGIARYGAELLRELACYYEIELVTDQADIDEPWVEANFPRLTLDEFGAQRDRFDRVVYQIGNSEHHAKLPDLLRARPGIVVLHDYFLGGLKSCIDERVHGGFFRRNLLECEGYAALGTWSDQGRLKAMAEFPMNADVLRDALAVIVHSPVLQARLLSEMGLEAGSDAHCIPHLRSVALETRRSSRLRLDAAPDTVLVCAFGQVAPSKMSLELVEAFSRSELSRRPNVRLVLVGGATGDYAKLLNACVIESGLGDKVTVTEFVPPDVYQVYLSAADVAVQLRAGSRGETSGAVLDCLAHGLPTIVSAHGTMTELDNTAVVKIADPLDPAELALTLDSLWADPDRRARLSQCAREVIARHHAPARVGEAYRDAIERSYALSRRARWLGHLQRASEAIRKAELSTGAVLDVARNMDAVRTRPGAKRILVDVTELAADQRAPARGLLAALLRAPTPGWRLELVRAVQENDWIGLRFARQFGALLVGAPDIGISDDVCEPRVGDVFVELARQGGSPTVLQETMLAAWRADGVAIYRSLEALIASVADSPAHDAPAAWIHLSNTLNAGVSDNGAQAFRARGDEIAEQGT
jgi:glycosyltransferase involved in cell wall biosynthesis